MLRLRWKIIWYCYFQRTYAVPPPLTSAPVNLAAPNGWCDLVLVSLSRSTAWTCRGRPTTRQSVPSGMQEAASVWQSSEKGFHLERWTSPVVPVTSGMRQDNSRQTRTSRHPKQCWWRVERGVCPRALRRLSAMAMTLWVVFWNNIVLPLWVTYMFHTFSSFFSLFLSLNGKMKWIRSRLNWKKTLCKTGNTQWG